MNERKYFFGMVGLLAPFWVIITWFVLTTPPYTGDMTRIGGYSEADYAPLGPQLRFEDPAFTKAGGLVDYDRPYDVLVIGDSFSQNKEHGWQSFLAEKTGLSILTFHQDDVDFKQLIAHGQYKQTPPKLVIYEIAEHGLHNFRFSTDSEIHPVGNSERNSLDLHLNAKPLNMIPLEKPAAGSLEIELGMHRLKLALKRWTGSSEKVYQVQMDTPSFFSSRRSDCALLYYGDFWKNSIPQHQWLDVRDQLTNLQGFIESQGNPLFILMIATDKSTAYRSSVQEPPMPILSGVELMGDVSSLNILPLQNALEQRIVDPTMKDVYLPNDTHWGFEGHKCAAEVVLYYLDKSPRVNLK